MKLTSTKRSQTTGYFITFITLGLATAALGPALPYLAEQTGSQLNQVSILFTTKAAGYLLGSIVGGRFYDRLPGHRVVFVGLVGMIITMLLTPTLPFLWLLSIILFILGASEGVVDVGGNTLLVWVHGHEIGPYMNALHLFFGVGTFLAPIILAQSVLRTQNITGGYWLIAFLIVPLAIWLLRIPHPAAPTTKKEKQGRGNTKLLILIVLFFFLYVGAEIGFGGWVFTYAVELGLANATTAAYLTATFWGTFTLGRLLSIPIAARVRPRWILSVDLGGIVLSLGLLLLFSESQVVLWGGTAVLGLSMASVFPTMISLAERRMTLTGTTTSWFFVGASLGSMFLPWLVGQLFEPIGPQVTILIFLVDSLLAMAIFVAVMRANQAQSEHHELSETVGG